MSPVAIFLVALAGIFLIGAIGELVFQRTSVPDVVWLIIAGILIGPVSGLVSRDQLGVVAPYFAPLTLVVVLFDGGSALRLDELSRAAPRSAVLAVVGFLFSVLGVAALSMLAAWIGVLPGEWSFMHALMLGAILGGSSSIIVMPAMSLARVEGKLANLVGLESALTDALCVVGTSALVDTIARGAAGGGEPVQALLRSFGVGAGVGLLAGLVWLVLALRLLAHHEHAYPVTLAALLLLYVGIDHAGGSAALGILVFAVLVGNARGLSLWIGFREPVELDTELRGFHRQVTFIIKSFFFVFIGAMLGPPWGQLALGVLFALVLLGVRIPATRLSLWKSDVTPTERRLVEVALPRGMAAGVLATLPSASGVPGTETLPVIVFACVLCTILIFAVGFPLSRRAMASAPATAAAAAPIAVLEPATPEASAATAPTALAPTPSVDGAVKPPEAS